MARDYIITKVGKAWYTPILGKCLAGWEFRSPTKVEHSGPSGYAALSIADTGLFSCPYDMDLMIAGYTFEELEEIANGPGIDI